MVYHIVEWQLINTEGMMELESYYLAPIFLVIQARNMN